MKSQYLTIKEEINLGIQRVLDHGQFILGPEVSEFETKLANYVGVQHVVSCASGTDALTLALMEESVGPGDAVFVPSFTFTATAEVVLLLGATPVFVDIDSNNFTIDCESLREAIESVNVDGKLRSRAVIPVDLFGLPADYTKLGTIAQQNNIVVIGDAAQSLGGKHRGRAVGSLAPVTATSFFPAKPLGCYGDGGALFTTDAERADSFRSLSRHGAGKGKYDIMRVGLNSRLDTIQAAILLAKLKVFEFEISARNRLSSKYALALNDYVKIPLVSNGDLSAWAQYTIQTEDRDQLRSRLAEKGVPSAVYYPRPMHLQTAYKAYGNGEGSLPVTEKLCKTVLSLPMHPYIDDEVVDFICDSVRSSL